ncbi:MAG: hypothetical protein DWQ01_03400 [Planctomycetota bacterium]|nr:MAG: hypothetical protein DWQ01_03400 [Planctomycetota bacterium]
MEETSKRSALGVIEILLAVLGFGAITYLYWHPFLLEPEAHYSVGRDYFQNSWNLWWTRFAWERQMPLLETSWLFHPSGTSLAFHTISFANSIPGLAIQDLVSQTATHSYLLVSAFFLSALGGWALVRYVTGSAWGAFLGGIMYSFNAYHTSMVTQLNNAQFQWIPLFLLALILLYRHGRWWHLIWASLMLALAGYADWYQPIFCVLAGGLLLVLWMLAHRRLFDFKFWGKLLLMGGLAALLMLPGIWPLLKIMMEGHEEQLADPVRYVGEMELLGVHPQGSPFLHSWPVVLGYSMSAVLLYALWRVRDRGIAVWWALLAVSFVLLQGPFLVAAKRHFPDIVLPMAFFGQIPGLSMVRVPHRFLILLVLALSVLLGYGLREWIHRTRDGGAVEQAPSRRMKAHLLGLGLCALLALEMQPKTRQAIDLQPAPFYSQELAQDDRSFAVLEIPLDFRDGYSMWLQTLHQKPLIGGYTSHILPEALPALQTPLMKAMLPRVVDNDILTLPEFEAVEVEALTEEQLEAWRRELLEQNQVGAVIFHHQPDFPVPQVQLPEDPGLWDKLYIFAMPFRFNRFVNNPELWRQLAAVRYVEGLAKESEQARRLMLKLFGPPTLLQGNAEIWDLRGELEARSILAPR